MSAHRAVVETGPDVIRRICCVADSLDGKADAALAAIDDDVTLVDETPVAVASLWSSVLQELAGGHPDGMLVIHPSWWSTARVSRVTTAVVTLGIAVHTRPRSWLLRHAAPDAAVVEITEHLTAVTGAGVVAVPHPAAAEQIADLLAAGAVVIDVPSTVTTARRRAASLTAALSPGRTVVEVDDARLLRLARRAAAIPADQPAKPAPPRPTARVGAAVVLALVAVAVPALGPAHRPTPTQSTPTTVLVEGRVAMTVPADWSAQRVVGGPGSARIKVTSPTDPEVALHLTQSPVPGETLAGTAERLQRAIAAEPAGVFVDFNASGAMAGRTAVSYREVRPAHQVRWAVLLDGDVRIGIGCQSRPGAQDAVRAACEQAVRSAHAI
ncbi:type VII secretion-associated protein [Mycobacterium sp. 1423905.2]|uniref:type VII secretion-associated protein n=1 Tax=Mycobacterium sp. 1423905.2 TaxID=1856859 RepID=UPI0007FF6F72|nr:type VII secretion-associated protein [Mycobacterium sp. 1423905.2]OBJ49575.1 type VII secretion-associated protein [Mycobacterium sp. 1423905.2]